jgi:hypothetical protein
MTTATEGRALVTRRAFYFGDSNYAACLDCGRVVWVNPLGRVPRHASDEDRAACPGVARRREANRRLDGIYGRR